jgi:hypothetical protein
MRRSRQLRTAAPLLALGLGLAACGGSGGSHTAGAAGPATTEAPAATTAPPSASDTATEVAGLDTQLSQLDSQLSGLDGVVTQADDTSYQNTAE